jgi:cysteine desulfurase/selenocysteine lyase
MRSYLDEISLSGPKDFALIDRHYKQLDETRGLLARLIGAAGPAEIGLCASGSEALSMLAGALSWQHGDEIILSEAEMISNVAPWLRVRDRFGVKIHFAPIREPGFVLAEEVEPLLSPRTKLISITHVPNTSGLVQPLEPIGRLARKAGIPFLVDAAASVGVVPVDVETLQCDLLVGTGRKYLRGPAGSAFVYCRSSVLPYLEPFHFGWKTGSWDWMNQKLTFLPDAARFHVGEPNFAAWIGLGAAVRYVFDIGGIEVVSARVRDLAGSLIGRLNSLPHVRVLGPQETGARSGIIMVDVAGIPPKIAADYLQARGIVVEGGHGYCPGPLRLSGVAMALRLALHYWNTEEDISAVVALLEKLRT